MSRALLIDYIGCHRGDRRQVVEKEYGLRTAEHQNIFENYRIVLFQLVGLLVP